MSIDEPKTQNERNGHSECHFSPENGPQGSARNGEVQMGLNQSWCNTAYQLMVNKFPNSDEEVVHEQAQQRLLEACQPRFHFENRESFIAFCLRFFKPRVEAALRRRRLQALAPLPATLADHRKEETTDAEPINRLYREVNSLSQTEQKIIRLYYYDRRSDSEIARRIYQLEGLVPERARRRVQRVRKSLVGRLRQKLVEDGPILTLLRISA